MNRFFQHKKILVTGHTGFKGAWLAQILNNWKANVIGVALKPEISPNLFTILSLKKSIKNYFADICDVKKMKEIFAAEKPEIVFHLAAQAIVRDSYFDPLKTYTTNILGTTHILETIRETPSVKAAVIITTDKVYENKEWMYPYREIDNLGGYDPYSASKAAADIVAQSYIHSFFNVQNFRKNHHTLLAIARAGNVIGGGDWANHRLIPDIVRGIFENKGTIMIRNPRAIRPWQHVLEPLSGYLMLAHKLYSHNVQGVGPWNFAPHEESFICVEDLVRKVLKLSKKKGDFRIERDDALHEANILKLDISKARNILGWSPKLNLHQNLEWTMKWYRQYYEKPKNIINFTNEQIHSFFDAI